VCPCQILDVAEVPTPYALDLSLQAERRGELAEVDASPQQGAITAISQGRSRISSACGRSISSTFNSAPNSIR
jgi:hypothetical protein